MEKDAVKIGVFGIIFDDRHRVLLCRRKDHDLWNLPGGALKNGEAPWDGARREVKEETGLNVEIKRIIGIYFKPKENDLVFTFLCDVKGGEIQVNDEAAAIEYFDLDSLPLNIIRKHIERIKDALNAGGEIVQKIQ